MSRVQYWDQQAIDLLSEGFGVEDIALTLVARGYDVTADYVRVLVWNLRNSGKLEAIYRPSI